MEKDILALKAIPSSEAVMLNVVGCVMPNGVLVNYATYQENKPKTYANYIYVWKTTSPDIPWGTTPVGKDAVATDTPVSTQQLDFPFEVGQDYIIGYAVGADPNAVCATVYVPADSIKDPTKYVSNNISLQFVYVGNNIVQIRFTGLGNYSPVANKNWVGIWQMDHVPYKGDPLAKVSIASSSSSGIAVLQGVQIVVGSVYSVGYFMTDAGSTSLAARVTFRT